MKLKLTLRIWILIISILFSMLAIFGIPDFQKGVLINSIETNSTAFEQGLRQGQIITYIDGIRINSLDDYSKAFEGKFISNESIKITINTDKLEAILFSNHPPNITVEEIKTTNIEFGLDIEGGARALIKAKDVSLSGQQTNDLADIINNRLNVFGITDLKVLPVSDLSGNNFLLIEIAGATPKDLENLISQQGKFEAKIGNETVFIGGNKDIASVCRNDATCAGIESCQQSQGGYFCNFRFSIYLSEEAAKKHAEITKNLSLNVSAQGNYLSKNLDLYLDDNLVDTLLISESLKGIVTTQISISGSGTGITQEEAFDNAEEEMHRLQTILITGSLPYKLEIIKLDTISPVLGEEFIRIILLAGAGSLLGVSLIIFFRYRKIKISLALLMVSFSEIIIILGVASLIEWNIDLPSIAGILATIGTGIDQQIIIADESKQGAILSIKQRMRRALAIIIGAYFTAVVSLMPLLWAGAGLLKGFAVTTLIGLTIGILITRPAFTDIIRKMEE